MDRGSETQLQVTENKSFVIHNLMRSFLKKILDNTCCDVLFQETVEIQAWLQGEAVSAVVVGGRTDAMSGRSYTSLGLVGCVEVRE